MSEDKLPDWNILKSPSSEEILEYARNEVRTRIDDLNRCISKYPFFSAEQLEWLRKLLSDELQ